MHRWLVGCPRRFGFGVSELGRRRDGPDQDEGTGPGMLQRAICNVQSAAEGGRAGERACSSCKACGKRKTSKYSTSYPVPRGGVLRVRERRDACGSRIVR